MSMQYAFPVEKGTFCLLSNLKNYLSLHHLPCSESWLGGLLGYMGFYYTPLPLPSKETIHGRSQTFPRIFSKLNKSLSEPLIIEEVLWDHGFKNTLDLVLCQDPFPLLWVNDYYLEYSPYYQLDPYWSLVILLEIDEENVLLFDNEVRCLKSATFMQAIQKNRHFTVAYTPKDLQWVDKEEVLVIRGLQTAMNAITANLPADNEYWGIPGMYKFAEDLNACEETARIYNFFFQMNRPGGLAATRKTMGSFLAEIQLRWNPINTQSCVELYGRLSEQWKKISNLLYKLSTSYDRDLKKRIVERVLHAIQLEEEGILLLSALASGLERGGVCEAVGTGQ